MDDPVILEVGNVHVAKKGRVDNRLPSYGARRSFHRPGAGTGPVKIDRCDPVKKSPVTGGAGKSDILGAGKFPLAIARPPFGSSRQAAAPPKPHFGHWAGGAGSQGAILSAQKPA